MEEKRRVGVGGGWGDKSLENGKKKAETREGIEKCSWLGRKSKKRHESKRETER